MLLAFDLDERFHERISIVVPGHFPSASTHNVPNEMANCAVAANAPYFPFCLQGVHKTATRRPSHGLLPLNAILFVC